MLAQGDLHMWVPQQRRDMVLVQGDLWVPQQRRDTVLVQGDASVAHFHTVHVHSYRYSHGTSIFLGLGTPLIVLLLCAVSPLSSQGAKTRTACDMANSTDIATFHKKWPTCIMMSLCKLAIASGLGTSIHGSLYFWGRSIQEMGGNVVIGLSIAIWGCCNRWIVILPLRYYDLAKLQILYVGINTTPLPRQHTKMLLISHFCSSIA